MGMLNIISKMNKLNSGEKVKLTYAEVCSIIINVQDANRNLTREQFEEFYKLFKEFQKAKTTEYEVDMNGYYEMCYDIITKFDKIAPYEKYSGASEIETSFLMNDIRSIEKEKKKIEETVKDVLLNNKDAQQNLNKEELNQNSNVLNQYRTSDIKRLLIEKGNNLPESDYFLYGNLFEIIANLISYKVDNQTMVDAFDELSDLILGKIPSFMAFVPEEQRLKIQIRYMNENGILQELTDEEKEAFAYCVWHATCIVVADEAGNMNSGLIDFDSVEHIRVLYEEDKSRQPDIFPSNELLSKEKIEKKDFGFNIDNPIHTTSIAQAYKLLKKIQYNGEPVNIDSQVAIESKNGHLIDLYELETPSGKTVEIYIDSYSNNNSEELPKGFSFVENIKTDLGIEKATKNCSTFIREELKNNNEYAEACKIIDLFNESITFKTKPGFAARYVRGNERLDSLIGHPKELGEAMVQSLNNNLTDKYYELISKYNDTYDSNVLVEISDLLHDVAFKIRDIQFGNTPICQREFEMYISPQLYWALEAAKQGNVEGYIREQRYLKFRGKDAVKAPDELIKAIQTKFAYEGDSDMQYELYERYHYNPKMEEMFNGPEINMAEKNEDKANYWKDKLSHNPNIKLSSVLILELVQDCKTPEVDKAMRKAMELNDPDYYYTIAEYFGVNSEIGFEYYNKNAYSKELFASSSCIKILDYYKSLNEKEKLKKYLMNWIRTTPYKDKWFSGESLYEKHYDLFKWLDDVDFDVEYLEYIIRHADEFWSKEAKRQKKLHLSISLFNGKITRKD